MATTQYKRATVPSIRGRHEQYRKSNHDETAGHGNQTAILCPAAFRNEDWYEKNHFDVFRSGIDRFSLCLWETTHPTPPPEPVASLPAYTVPEPEVYAPPSESGFPDGVSYIEKYRLGSDPGEGLSASDAARVLFDDVSSNFIHLDVPISIAFFNLEFMGDGECYLYRLEDKNDVIGFYAVNYFTGAIYSQCRRYDLTSLRQIGQSEPTPTPPQGCALGKHRHHQLKDHCKL